MKDLTLKAEKWREIARRVFEAWGASRETADCVAESLVNSDLAGVYSHGMIRVSDYVAHVKAGWLLPGGTPEIVHQNEATAVVDGRYGFGQPAALMALEAAMGKAHAQGIAAVSVLHCGHIGRLGEYAEKAAAAGMVALVAASAAGNGGLVVPFGGAERVFSTNPIAAGVPARDHPAFIMDFATSVVAAGKLELAPDQDMKIPEGWAVDKEGRPATTPRQFMDGGGLLPFGAHKGYALSLLVELLCSAMTGAGVPVDPNKKRGLGFPGNSAFLIVLDVGSFTEVERFYDDVDGLFDRLESVRPAPGFQKVMIPGAPENASREKRNREGFMVPGAILERIWTVAAERHLDLGSFIGG